MPEGGRRPILLLVNVAAGRKAGAVRSDQPPTPGELRQSLASRDLRVELRELAEHDDPSVLARTAATDGRDVVVAGGDGTVGPAASGLVGSKATLGILPLGTFNNIARGVGVPTDFDHAVDVIARGRAVSVDAGVAWHLAPDEAAETGGELGEPPQDATTFFEAAGVGLDAAGFGVAQVGGRLGWLQAAKAAWRVSRRRKTPVWLFVDGTRYRIASPAVTICNGPFHGFGFALVPEADPADGLLDVVVFGRMGRLEVLRHFLRVARGRRVREPRVHTVRGRQVVVGGVRRAMPAHADGRSIGATPVAVTVRPGALRVFV